MTAVQNARRLGRLLRHLRNASLVLWIEARSLTAQDAIRRDVCTSAVHALIRSHRAEALLLSLIIPLHAPPDSPSLDAVPQGTPSEPHRVHCTMDLGGRAGGLSIKRPSLQNLPSADNDYGVRPLLSSFWALSPWVRQSLQQADLCALLSVYHGQFEPRSTACQGLPLHIFVTHLRLRTQLQPALQLRQYCGAGAACCPTLIAGA